MARAIKRKPPKDREPRSAESMKRSPRRRRGKGGDPRTLPGAQDLGDQQQPQTTGGMVKGT
jgi:hypothetical protein